MFHNEIVNEKPQLHLCVFTWVWACAYVCVCVFSYFRTWRFIVCTNFNALFLGNQLLKPVVILCFFLFLFVKLLLLGNMLCTCVNHQMRMDWMLKLDRAWWLENVHLIIYWLIDHWFNIINCVSDSVWIISMKTISVRVSLVSLSVE